MVLASWELSHHCFTFLLVDPTHGDEDEGEEECTHAATHFGRVCQTCVLWR